MDLHNFISKISLDGEIWVDIPGYEEFYMISSLGRIISKARLVNNRYKDVLKPHKLLKINIDENRKSIQLTDGSSTKKFSISQLVAASFIPKPHKDYILRFKDLNPLNCLKDNLIWCPKIDRHANFIIDDLPGELWKDIIGYENLYRISNKGRVMSLSRPIQASNRIIYTQNRLLVLNINVHNYLYVTLVKNKKSKHYPIHRLVATAFIENPNNYPAVDHIDTNKCNNCVENLRWVTPKMNMLNPNTKQHLSKVRKNIYNKSWNCTQIVLLYKSEIIKIYPSIAEASRDGFEYSSIQKCLYGRQRTHKKFCWMYLSDYAKLSPERVVISSESTQTVVSGNTGWNNDVLS